MPAPTDELLQLLLAILALFTLLRIYSLLRGAIWNARWGSKYEEEKQKTFAEREPTEEEEWPLLDANGGKFLPFGVRSYRLARWAAGGSGAAALLLHRPVHAFRTLWRYFVFPLVWGALLCVLSVWPKEAIDPTGSVYPDTATRWLGLSLGLLCMLGMIIIAAEGVFSHLVRKSWAVAYHRFGVKGSTLPAVREFQVFFGTGLLTYIITVCTVVFCAHRFGGFPDMNSAVSSGFWPTLGAGALNCLEYLLAIDSADPDNGPAQLVTTLIILINVAFVLIFFAIILGNVLSPQITRNVPPTDDGPKPEKPGPVTDTGSVKPSNQASMRTLLFGGAIVAGILVLREVAERFAR